MVHKQVPCHLLMYVTVPVSDGIVLLPCFVYCVSITVYLIIHVQLYVYVYITLKGCVKYSVQVDKNNFHATFSCMYLYPSQLALLCCLVCLNYLIIHVQLYIHYTPGLHRVQCIYKWTFSTYFPATNIPSSPSPLPPFLSHLLCQPFTPPPLLTSQVRKVFPILVMMGS